MRRPALKEDLVPVNEFRTGLARYIRRVGKTGRPVVLTQRGRAAAALVSPAMLDELEEQQEVVRKILRGLRDVKAGRLIEDAAVWRDVESLIAKSER